MKSYIQGLVTGGVHIFAYMVLTGCNYTTYDADDIMDKLDDIESNVSFIKLYGVDCY